MSAPLTRRTLLQAARAGRPLGVSAARAAALPAARHRDASYHNSSQQEGPSRSYAGAASSVLLVGALSAAAYTLSTHRTPGGELHLEAAAPAAQASIEDSDEHYRKDPATGTPIPLRLSLPHPSSSSSGEKVNLELVGLGVRTVSFLSIRVYVAALYVDKQAWIEARKSDPSLPAPPALPRSSSSPAPAAAAAGSSINSNEAPTLDEETHLRPLLANGTVPLCIRILPVRSTDFSHLRDGFVRSLQSRLKLIVREGAQQLASKDPEGLGKKIEEEFQDHFSRGIQSLKDLFPNKTALPKGDSLDLLFFRPHPSAASSNTASQAQAGGHPHGLSLALQHQGTTLGVVPSPPQDLGKKYSVASELFLAYFANKGEISKPVSRDRLQAESDFEMMQPGRPAHASLSPSSSPNLAINDTVQGVCRRGAARKSMTPACPNSRLYQRTTRNCHANQMQSHATSRRHAPGASSAAYPPAGRSTALRPRAHRTSPGRR